MSNAIDDADNMHPSNSKSGSEAQMFHSADALGVNNAASNTPPKNNKDTVSESDKLK